MPRLPYPAPEDLTPEMRQALSERLPLNIYKMLGHMPTFASGWFTLGRAVLYQADLSAQLRELAILRVGTLSNCVYEVHQHRRLAATVGLSAEKIAAAEKGEAAAVFDEREKLVLRFTEQVVLKVKSDKELFDAVVASLGARQTMELMVTIGFYMMAARIMENTELELEEGGGPSLEDAKRVRALVQEKLAKQAEAGSN